MSKTIDKPRIYPHPSILTNCLNCDDVRVESKNKEIIRTWCKRYGHEIDTHSALNGRFPDFCKLYGENCGRSRIYPDPIIITCCVNCPANRRDLNINTPPLKYKCYEYDQYVDFVDVLMNGHFPEFCNLKVGKRVSKHIRKTAATEATA
jgi:hypothetical protein